MAHPCLWPETAWHALEKSPARCLLPAVQVWNTATAVCCQLQCWCSTHCPNTEPAHSNAAWPILELHVAAGDAHTEGAGHAITRVRPWPWLRLALAGGHTNTGGHEHAWGLTNAGGRALAGGHTNGGHARALRPHTCAGSHALARVLWPVALGHGTHLARQHNEGSKHVALHVLLPLPEPAARARARASGTKNQHPSSSHSNATD